MGLREGAPENRGSLRLCKEARGSRGWCLLRPRERVHDAMEAPSAPLPNSAVPGHGTEQRSGVRNADFYWFIFLSKEYLIRQLHV